MRNKILVAGLIGLISIAPTLSQEMSMQTGSVYREESSSIASFCRDRLVHLKRAYRNAEIESRNGNVEKSAEILVAGLRTANANIPRHVSNSLTAKAIKRGLVLAEAIKASPNDRQKVRGLNHFLFNYYGFIERVSEKLDIPYFVASDRRYARFASNTQLEKLFVSFAKEQVDMALETLSTEDRGYYGSVVYPIGSSTMLLTALQVTTNAMINDLLDSVFAARYSCTVDELAYQNQRMVDYLSTRTGFNDDFEAVQEIVTGVKSALGNYYCSEHGGLETSRTNDAISTQIRLDAGTTQQVRLGSTQYVKKLIISAEGIRNDAMFDVVVNGDVKGTIYVPGRDPSYFVTIEDATSSIELVSRNGSALITRILVVTE